MRVYFQIIGTSADTNTSPSLVLVCDELKILFNAGEGLVHHCTERGIKLNNLAGLFGCGVDWRSWGGLGDLVFWQTETSQKQLSIYGPKNLIDLVTSFRYSLWSPDFELKVSELDSEPIVVKNGVEVFPVVVRSDKSKVASSPPPRQIMMNPCFRDNILFAKSEAKTDSEREELERIMRLCEKNLVSAQKSLDQSDWPQENSQLGIFVSFDRPSMFLAPVPQLNVLSYVVQLPTLPPKIDAQKAKKLGIKGADIGRICRGESVVVDKNVITPEQCWAVAPQPGPCFIVAYCPDVHYVDSLVASPTWTQFYDPLRERQLAAVVHMTPYAIIQSEKYAAWIKKFPESVQHIFLNRDLCNTEDSNAKFKSFFSNLVQLDPEVFYVAQHFDSHFSQKAFPPLLAELNSGVRPRAIAGDVGLIYNLVPSNNMGIVKDPAAASLPHSSKERLDYEQHDNQLVDLVQEYRSLADQSRSVQKSNFYEIHFLGTGAASASSLRNEAGILVDICNYGAFIMDCGSHTYTQMAKKFGHGVKKVLKKLKMIWISHRHPDHNGGLLHILVERQHAFEEDGETAPLIPILGPYWIEGKLLEYSLISRHQLRFAYYHNGLFTSESNPLQSFFQEELGITSFRTAIVWHCRDAYGSSITSKDGWKLSYSGDCRPSDSFVQLARGSDVMIHEATMCDQDQNLAVQKNHSCTCEVLSVAKQAGVHRVAFTHFSRRQDSVPVQDFVQYRAAVAKQESSPASQEDLDRAIIAFDMMTCRQRDIDLLPKLLPSLCRLHQVLGK